MAECKVYDQRSNPCIQRKVRFPAAYTLAEAKARIEKILKIKSEAWGGIVIETNVHEQLTAAVWQKRDFTELHIVPSSNRGIRREAVTFQSQPHYDAVVESGQCEYFESSNGRIAAGFALAEFIDNSLMATRGIKDREILIRVFKSDRHDAKSPYSILIADNGTGMDLQDVSDWARYHNTYERRKDRKAPLSNPDHLLHRYLNSYISFFGVGAKQAGFYLGSTLRMISRKEGSDKVLEIALSKDAYEERDKQQGPVFEERVERREPGQVLPSHDGFEDLVKQEPSKDHFTYCVVEGIPPNRMKHFKEEGILISTLKHIYHYYIHGFHGNVDITPSALEKKYMVDLLFERTFGKCVKINLRDVNTDYQSQLVRSAYEVDGTPFNFEIELPAEDGGHVVQGQLRYHPFVNDQETYPVEGKLDDTDDEGSHVRRIDQPIFAVYWNGRLISDSTVKALPFCSYELLRKRKGVKRKDLQDEDVYHRLSGTLWLGSPWAVTTNKMTLMENATDLLGSEKNILRVLDANGNKIRSKDTPAHSPSFDKWLAKCHADLDKQIAYSGPIGTVRLDDRVYTKFRRATLTKSKLEAGYKIKVFKQGVGTILAIMLEGDHTSDVTHSLGKEALIRYCKEPASIHNEQEETIAIRMFSVGKAEVIPASTFAELIAKEELKLPKLLEIQFPDAEDGMEASKAGNIEDGATVPVGTIIGDFRIAALTGSNQEVQVSLCKGMRIRMTIEYKPTYMDSLENPPKERVPFEDYCKLKAKTPDWEKLKVFEGQFANKTDKWYFRHVNFNEAGHYRIVFDALPAKALVPEAKRAKRQDAEPRIKTIDRAVLRWTQTPASIRKIKAQLIYPLDGQFRLNPQAELLVQVAWEDRYGNRCRPYVHPALQKPKEAGGGEWTPDLECENIEVDIDKAKAKVIRDRALLAISVPFTKLREVDGQLPQVPRKGIEDVLKVTSNVSNGKRVVTQSTNIDFHLLPGRPATLQFNDEQLVNNVVSMTHGDPIPCLKVKVMDEFGAVTLPETGDMWNLCGVVTRHGRSVVFNYELPTDGTPSQKEVPFNLAKVDGRTVVTIDLYLTKTGTSPKNKGFDFDRDLKPFVLPGVEPLHYKMEVLPGSQPYKLTLWIEEDDLNRSHKQSFALKTSAAAVKPLKVRARAGQKVRNMRFKLYTEAAEELKLTPQLMEKLKLELDWNPKEEDKEALLQGVIPPMGALRNVNDDAKRYTMTLIYKKRIIEAAVAIVAVADVPTKLTATFLNSTGYPGDTVITAVEDGLKVSACDRYSNPVNMKAYQNKDAYGLELSTGRAPLVTMAEEQRTLADQNESLVITGFAFQCDPRIFNVHIALGSLKASVDVRVVAGLPSGLLFPEFEGKTGDANWDHHLQAVVGEKLATPVVLSLVDDKGNPCDMSVIDAATTLCLELKTDQAKLKGNKPFPVNSVNRIDVGCFTVHGAPGTYELGFFLKTPGSGDRIELSTKVYVNLTSDKLKLAQTELTLLKDGSDPDRMEVASGSVLPELLLKLLNPEGDAINAATWSSSNKGNVVAKLRNQRTKATITLACEPRDEGFVITSTEPLKYSGETVVIVTVNVNDKRATKPQKSFKLNVVAGQPTRIVSKDAVDALSACNVEGANVVLPSLHIQLEDDHGNACAASEEELSLSLSVSEPNGPKLDNAEGFTITGTAATLPEIALREGTVAPNGEYTLVIALEDDDDVKPLKIKFAFSDNAKLNAQMQALNQKLMTVEATMRSAWPVVEKIQDNLGAIEDERDKLHAKQKQHIKKKANCLPKGVRGDIFKDEASMNQLSEQLKATLRQTSQHNVPAQRKMPACPVETTDDILGTLGNLIAVDKQAVQEVISWAMGSNVEMIVTRSREAAFKCRPHRVIPLETVNSDSKQRERSNQLITKFGGLHMLTYIRPLRHHKECFQVLEQFYGNTYIFPTVQAAQDYRAALKQHSRGGRVPFPTIFTMTGEKVESSGAMFGNRNTMPAEGRRSYRLLAVQDGKREHLQDALDALEEGVELAQQLEAKEAEYEQAELEKQGAEYKKAQSDCENARRAKDKLLSELEALKSQLLKGRKTPSAKRKRR
eukprot:m.235683 g.235683  ORF g.235683 m.235683 type:complete len:2076 (-) comp17408_c0_seq1:166-6393(-)